MMKKTRGLLPVFVSLIFTVFAVSAIFAQNKDVKEIKIEQEDVSSIMLMKPRDIRG